MFDEDNEFRKVSRECMRLSLSQKYDEAKSILEEFLQSHPFSYTDSKYEYHYFKHFEEKMIFEVLHTPSKEVKFIYEDYCRVFNTYAFVLFNLGEYAKAKAYLKISLDLNPVDVNTLWSLSKIFDAESNGECVEKTLKKALSLVHETYDLFDAYEYLANYYAQINEMEISRLLFSLKNEDSLERADKSNMKMLFEKYGLPWGFDSTIIQAMEYAYQQANTRASFEESYDLYYDYYELCQFNEKYFK